MCIRDSTYDCYLKNLVRTLRSIYPSPWAKVVAKTLLWDRLWTLTEHIYATEHDINNQKEICQSTQNSYMPPQILWTLVQKRLRTGWRVFAHPLNLRTGRHCQHCRMDVIIIIIIIVYYANKAANIHAQLHVQGHNKNIKRKKIKLLTCKTH